MSECKSHEYLSPFPCGCRYCHKCKKWDRNFCFNSQKNGGHKMPIDKDNKETLGRLMTTQWAASSTTQHIEKAYLIAADIENSIDAKSPEAVDTIRLKQLLKETLKRAYVTQSAVSYLAEVI